MPAEHGCPYCKHMKYQRLMPACYALVSACRLPVPA
nr:MAG TPA: Transcription elongation factor Elf1 like [Caudoviricetes sp.]